MSRRVVAAIVGVLLALLLLPASPVSAHASVVSTDPADGAVLAAAPKVIDIEFSEEVLLAASKVTLIELGSGTHIVLPLKAINSGRTLQATMPAVPNGAYVVRYLAVDPADLHKTVGSISFGIGVEAPPSETGAQLDGSWFSVWVKAITQALMVLGVGAVLLVLLHVRRGGEAVRRIFTAATWCLAGVAVGWIVLFLLDVASVGWRNAQWGKLLISSDPGRRALVGLVFVAGVWWAGTLVQRATGPAREFAARVAVVISLLFVVAAAYGGHAGIGGLFAVGVLIRFVHLLSLCIWIGTVASLWWFARRDASLGRLWPDVSRLAAIGLALTGASGFLLSGRVVQTVTALLGTTYGRVVVAKFVLVAVLALLGAVAALRVAKGSSPRVVAAEMVVAAAALVLASVLSSSAPARGDQFSPVADVAPQVVTGDVKDLTVNLAIAPARPGENLVTLKVLERNRPAPGVVESVTFTMSQAGKEAVRRQGIPKSGVLEWADISLTNPGTYDVTVAIARPDAPVPDYTATVKVASPPVPKAKTVVSTREWAPLALLLAFGWLVLVAAGRWATTRRQGSKR
jgi:methionine-rich copper-binding protein CopC/putative copper export protein